ncbi:regulator of cell morphogenesis and NO signaling [Cyclobacterium xiamenense]|uniref:Regulator of cell morphogenesis and NO signaling n=1 Tax=Cyclobacterium xiamenense TaxID=1297121 RepID=A0A1H6Z4P3_9BACT|nr:DUF542 domain-containing protein [Cyclobacterium xiamenense]SEJ47676.1 regulator of cell morphogenesis and NO signaling [Cyclobacterium xiamenense]
MDLDMRTASLGAIVTANSWTTDVFDAYGIDYCCRGSERLSDTCERLSIPLDLIADQLQSYVDHHASPRFSFDFWPIGLLASYIERKHHRYVKTQIPLLVNLFKEALHEPSEQMDILFEVKRVFWKAAEDLLDHIQREERILFPYLRKMEANEEGDIPFAAPHFGTVRHSIINLFREHEKEGIWLQQIRDITNNFSLPAQAGYWERLLFPQLAAFEQDMKTHLHLENNILFPKALAVAEKVGAGA